MANCARLIRRSLDIFVINGMETREGGEVSLSASLTSNPILILESGKKGEDGLTVLIFFKREDILLFDIF